MAQNKKSKKEMPKEQQTSFKELSFSDKVRYIFGYYKYYMLAAVIIIAAAGYTIYSFVQNNYDIKCNIVVVDGKITGYDTYSDDITKNFTRYIGLDGKKERVELDCHYSLTIKPLDQEANISQNKIYILASVGSIDGYMANRDYIDYFSTDAETFLYDLKTGALIRASLKIGAILAGCTDDELAKIGEENIIYYTTADKTRIPIAVDLTNTKVKTDTDLTLESPCYGVVVSAKNPENAIAFIRYAFDL